MLILMIYKGLKTSAFIENIPRVREFFAKTQRYKLPPSEVIVRLSADKEFYLINSHPPA